jgi:hypothetical protein
MSVNLIHNTGLKGNNQFTPMTHPASRPDTCPWSHESPVSGKVPAIPHYRSGYLQSGG